MRDRVVTLQSKKFQLQVNENLLWERIQDRLLREPSRARLQEVRCHALSTAFASHLHHICIATYITNSFAQGKKKWMQTTLEWYNTFEWDLVRRLNHNNSRRRHECFTLQSVSNGRQAIAQTADSVIQSVQVAHDLSDDVSCAHVMLFAHFKHQLACSQIFVQAANHCCPTEAATGCAAAQGSSQSAAAASDPRMRSLTGNDELASLGGDFAGALDSPAPMRRAASDAHMPFSCASLTTTGSTPALPCCSIPPSEAGSSCGTPTLRHQRMAPSPQSRDSPLTNPESSLDASAGTPCKLTGTASRSTALSSISASLRLRCGSAHGEDAIWDEAAVEETAQALSFD